MDEEIDEDVDEEMVEEVNEAMNEEMDEEEHLQFAVDQKASCKTGVLKIYTSIFLIYFQFLKLYLRNHFWKSIFP